MSEWGGGSREDRGGAALTGEHKVSDIRHNCSTLAIRIILPLSLVADSVSPSDSLPPPLAAPSAAAAAALAAPASSNAIKALSTAQSLPLTNTGRLETSYSSFPSSIGETLRGVNALLSSAQNQIQTSKWGVDKTRR